MPGLLDKHNVVAAFGQQGGCGAAGRAAAHHQHVAFNRLRHAIPPLIEITWPVI